MIAVVTQGANGKTELHFASAAQFDIQPGSPDGGYIHLGLYLGQTKGFPLQNVRVIRTVPEHPDKA